MSTIHIGIGHNNNLVVTKLTDIEILINTGTKRCDHCLNLGVSKNSVKTRLLHIQNFSTKRKNCLCRTVSGCLSTSAGRISLYDVDFTVFRIFITAVSQFAGKCRTIQRCFSSGKISCFSRCIPCSLGKYCFITDNLCNSRILLQKICQLL